MKLSIEKVLVHYVALSRVRRRMITAVFYLNLVVGCAAAPQLNCPSSEELFINEMIYFGTAKPHGVVTPKEWEDFLRLSITPRFPKGFTFWQATGQWQNSARAITREASYIVSLVHPDDGLSEKTVSAFVNEYKLRFKQEAVLRVKNPVCSGKGTFSP